MKAVVGSAECDDCLEGAYIDTVAARACVSCPSDTWTLAEASTRLTDCLCNAGYTGPDGGACGACEAGKAKGALACDDCAANKFSAAAATECTYSRRGERFNYSEEVNPSGGEQFDQS